MILAKLSLQRALLGYVSSHIRGVAFSLEGMSIKIRCYVDGEISEDDCESSSCVETEVIADYDSGYDVTAECLRLDYPLTIDDQGIWVFRRQES